MDELIVVKQLPVIEEQLHALKERWEQYAMDAESMVCTPETIQAVKGFRADMRKEYAEAEGLMKLVREQVMAPYNQLKATFDECATQSFRKADIACAKKIGDVENDIKSRCEDGLREYFAELCAVRHLDWLDYERTGIKVDMASAKAKTPKKLREQLAAFVSQVGDSVDRIVELDDAEEIMVEFRKSLDAADAICTVQERHRRIEEERTAQEARKVVLEQEAEAVRRVEALAPPVAVERAKKNPDDIFESFTYTVFNVKRSQLWKIRDFLKMEGIKYE